MHAKKTEIQTVSFVHRDGQLVSTDDLTPQERQKIATWLKTTYWNSLLQEEGTFIPAAQ